MVISEVKPDWPPDEVLELVGMTRAEWDRMTESIRRRNLPWDWLVESAMRRAARRRAKGE